MRAILELDGSILDLDLSILDLALSILDLALSIVDLDGSIVDLDRLITRFDAVLAALEPTTSREDAAIGASHRLQAADAGCRASSDPREPPSMPATLIDGKAIAAKVRAEVASGVKRRLSAGKRAPGLTVVRVGEDPASKIYVGSKIKACAEVGFVSNEIHPDASISPDELLAIVARLNADPSVHGILVQFPLPKHIDERVVLRAIEPRKDVDGFHPYSAGSLMIGQPAPRACTPFGVMRLLKETGVDLAGKRAVVLGRSNIVGKPMALLLLEANATVTVCHSKTADLAGEVGRADVLVAAIGRGHFVQGSWIKPGAVVIDVGQNRQADGKVWGDVDFEAARERASAITPVPGGVGPMTVAMLLANTLAQADQFD